MVESSSLPAGRYVMLEVRDNGEGMSSEVQQRVVRALFQHQGGWARAAAWG